MSRGKIETRINSLTYEESNTIGIEIERLLKGEMKWIANKYIRQYSRAVYDTFGWAPEDLLQNIRIAMWKGLATFEPSKNFKVTTYLSVILYHYFMSLSKKCRSNKNSQAKLVCVEQVFESIDDEPADEPDFAGSDDRLDYHHNLQMFLEDLDEIEKKIVEYYFNGAESASGIARQSNLPKKVVLEAVRNIEWKMKAHVMWLEDSEERKNHDIPELDPNDRTDYDLEA